MFFLLRVGFWLGLVLVLLPTFGSSKPPSENAVQVSAGEAMSAASATVSDMWRFCDRQPEACAVGAQSAAALGHKMQAGARMLYEFFQDRRAAQATGSTSRGKAAGDGAGTLAPADIAPPWRGPRKDAGQPA